MRPCFLLALLLLVANAAADTIYKWTDERGVVHYGDKPLGPGAKPAKLPALQTFSVLDSKKKGGGKKSRVPPSEGPSIAVTAPSPDATLSSADGKFTVAVAVSPGLGTGQNLNYYLDGELQNSTPTPSLAFLFTGAEKGDHMISVGVIDGNGRELSRSDPVIVHLQQAAKAP